MPVQTKVKPVRVKKLSRIHAPDDWDLHHWQRELRRQFGPEQPFTIKNLGDHPVFSEFSVFNPNSKRTYRVVIRGESPGKNYCSCPDYAVNTLGTCKHIEKVLHQLRRRHVTVLRRGYTPSFAELFIEYGAQRTLRFSPGTSCPAGLRKLADRWFDESGRLRSRAGGDFSKFLEESGAFEGHLRVYDDALALVAEQRDLVLRRKRLQTSFGDLKSKAWRELLKVELHPYQREGALFAAIAGRAIIADDMGLGKTIQAIASAEILARHVGVERVLVICPASLKYQWLQEIGQFSERKACVIEGSLQRRRDLYSASDCFFKIANYEVVHYDLKAIADWRPDLVILDEAQRIKNWETRTAKTIKKIESPFAIVLTGTPLENRLEELHSIVEFVDRFRLGPLFSFKAEHAEYEPETTKVVGYRNLNKISATLGPILIRRTKDQVLKQLPPRMDKNFFVPMTPQQMEPHDENKEIVARIVQKWHRYHFLSEADQLRMRIALQNMRMSCDNTYLLDKKTRFGVKVDELCKLLEEVFEQRDAKVVIFSQWLRMNELVADMLDAQKWGHVQLHGGVPSKDRKDLIRTLREDKDCKVFLSTDAGGVGLNLQAANTIINMDLPWNPAILEQRIGRVHRMGQGKPVRVVNFISEGTIEHGMLSLLKFKKSVFAGVLDGASDRVFMGDSALNRFMKTVETATTSAPAVPQAPLLDDQSGESLADIDEPADSTDSLSNGNGTRRQGMAQTDNAATGHAGKQSLGELLALGAGLLQTISHQWSGSNGSKSMTTPDSLPRIERDPKTGKSELRISLPEAQVLQQWVGQIAEAVRDLKLDQLFQR